MAIQKQDRVKIADDLIEEPICTKLAVNVYQEDAVEIASKAGKYMRFELCKDHERSAEALAVVVEVIADNQYLLRGKTRCSTDDITYLEAANAIIKCYYSSGYADNGEVEATLKGLIDENNIKTALRDATDMAFLRYTIPNFSVLARTWDKYRGNAVSAALHELPEYVKSGSDKMLASYANFFTKRMCPILETLNRCKIPTTENKIEVQIPMELGGSVLCDALNINSFLREFGIGTLEKAVSYYNNYAGIEAPIKVRMRGIIDTGEHRGYYDSGAAYLEELGVNLEDLEKFGLRWRHNRLKVPELCRYDINTVVNGKSKFASCNTVESVATSLKAVGRESEASRVRSECIDVGEVFYKALCDAGYNIYDNTCNQSHRATVNVHNTSEGKKPYTQKPNPKKSEPHVMSILGVHVSLDNGRRIIREASKYVEGNIFTDRTKQSGALDALIKYTCDYHFSVTGEKIADWRTTEKVKIPLTTEAILNSLFHIMMCKDFPYGVEAHAVLKGVIGGKGLLNIVDRLIRIALVDADATQRMEIYRYWSTNKGSVMAIIRNTYAKWFKGVGQSGMVTFTQYFKTALVYMLNAEKDLLLPLEYGWLYVQIPMCIGGSTLENRINLYRVAEYTGIEGLQYMLNTFYRYLGCTINIKSNPHIRGIMQRGNPSSLCSCYQLLQKYGISGEMLNGVGLAWKENRLVVTNTRLPGLPETVAGGTHTKRRYATCDSVQAVIFCLKTFRKMEEAEFVFRNYIDIGEVFNNVLLSMRLDINNKELRLGEKYD